MGSATGSKAYFQNIDSGDQVFVQFNPKEYKVNDKANYKASDAHQATDPLLTYEKGDPSTVTMELTFDSTDTGTDVFAAYVEKLRGFVSPTVLTGQKDKQGNALKRPPFCKFVWKDFQFDCVVESLASSCILFKADGTPLRAKVTVNLKRRTVEEHNTAKTDSLTLSSMGTMFSGSSAAATTTTVAAGQTLTSIAPDNWREVAAANGISDPTDLQPGQQLVIPLDSDLATVLTGQFMSYNPNKWVGDLAIQDYGSGYTGPATSSQGSSAFDDSSDLGGATLFSAAESAVGKIAGSIKI